MITPRQKTIIKEIAKYPYGYTVLSLSLQLNVNKATVQRDINKLKSQGFVFRNNSKNALFLLEAGWEKDEPVEEQSIRQLKILGILRVNPQGLGLQDIIVKFNYQKPEPDVTDEKIKDDLADLVTKHLIIKVIERYLIKEHYVSLPIYLSDTERSLLFSAFELAKQTASLANEYQTLEAKIRMISGTPYRGNPYLGVYGTKPGHDPRLAHVCSIIEKASMSSQIIHILYRPINQDAEEFTIKPLGITYEAKQDQWYMLAYDVQDDDEIVTYYVKNIIFLEVKEECFTLPLEFNLADRLKDNWTIESKEILTEVRVRFIGGQEILQKVKDNFKDRDTCNIIETHDEVVIVDKVKDLKEFASWLVPFGTFAQVIEPWELSQMVINRIRTILKVYEENA